MKKQYLKRILISKARPLFLLFGLLLAYANANAQAPAYVWVRQAGTNATGNEVAADNQGNSYAVGSFQGSATFGTTALTSAGNNDIFVVKYDPDGNVLWARRQGGTSSDAANSIDVDGSGNSYVTGTYQGSVTFGTTTLTNSGGDDVFVVKYDPAGNVLWARKGGGSSPDVANSITVDGTGNSYVTGTFEGNTTFGTTTLNSAGNRDVFVVKYDTAGNFLWARRGGGSSTDIANGISVDAAGNSYISGNYQGTATFGTAPALTNSGGDDIFVVKYDPAGTVLWARRAGTSNTDLSNSISVDAAGNSYITGSYQGTITFGTAPPLTNSGNSDVFVVKYDTAGNVVWARRAGSSSSDTGNSIAVDGAGNPYVTGVYQGSITFGTTSLTNSGNNDIFVAKYDGAGNVLWATRASGTNTEIANSIAVDGSGNSFLTGSFQGTTNFGTIQRTTSGTAFFIAKLGTDNSIATSPINPTTYCPGSTVSVSFTITGPPFAANNVFTAQLSDASGSFATPTNIGTLNGTGAGTITATIPITTPPGTGYRIRVVSSNPSITGTNNGTNLTILPTQTYYQDADTDGFGNLAQPILACSQPPGYVSNSTDCNDLNAAVNPDATEVCDGIDNDCDGQTDEGVQTTFYADVDGDGFGNPLVTTEACTAPTGFVANNTDCDDNDSNTYPGAPELCDGKDNNCDNVSDTGAGVTGFNLIDACTNQPIQPLVNGAVLNLATLQTRSLNIQALTNPSKVGSVLFDLSGQQTKVRSDDSGPHYSLHGDKKGNYFSWTPPVGTYTLTAGTYSKSNGCGTPGCEQTITFTVIDQPATNTSVTGFNLINAVSNQPIKPLVNGDVLNLATLPTRKLNIQALTNPAKVGSVLFNLSGQESKVRSDDSGPGYSLQGDKNGDYFNWTPKPGTYTLRAQSYSGSNGTGTPGGQKTITFTVIDQEQYTIGMTLDGQGTMSYSPYQLTYPDGSEVVVTATPAPGYKFIGWGGDASGTTYPLRVKMNRNKNIVAKFIPDNVNQANTSANTRLVKISSPIKTTEVQDVKVYPNPFKDAFTLEFLPGNKAENAKVTLTTLEGKTVYQKEIKVAGGNRHQEELFGPSKLPSGMYLLKLQLGEKLVVLKVVKH